MIYDLDEVNTDFLHEITEMKLGRDRYISNVGDLLHRLVETASEGYFSSIFYVQDNFDEIKSALKEYDLNVEYYRNQNMIIVKWSKEHVCQV